MGSFVGLAAHRRARPAEPPQPSGQAAVEPLTANFSGDVVSAMTDVLKPYFLLACVAFFVGFAGYLAIQRTVADTTIPYGAAAAPTLSPATAPTTPLARARSI